MRFELKRKRSSQDDEASPKFRSIVFKFTTIRNQIFKKNSKFLLIIGVIVLVSTAYIYLSAANRLRDLEGNVTKNASSEQKLVNTIREHFELPQEQPQIRTVGNTEELKGQELFARAKSGDKVLIFTKGKRALLYRPSTSKVIEYSQIEIK